MAAPTDAPHSPVDFLSAMLGANLPDEPTLRAYEAECRRVPVEELADSTPSADDIRTGYAAGVIWRGYVQETALPVFLLMYIAAFHDPRLIDVFTPTLIVTQMIDKYAPEPIRSEWLTRLKARDGSTPQGAVWLDGSVRAAQSGDHWQLSGRVDKPHNFDAQIALVAASVNGHDIPVLFFAPNFQANTGETTFDGNEAWLLGEVSDSAELIEEIEGIHRVASSFGAVALAQRRNYSGTDNTEGWLPTFKAEFAIGWTAVELLNWTWRETPILISDTARLFRCVVRMAQVTNQQGLHGNELRLSIFEQSWGQWRTNTNQYLGQALQNTTTSDAVIAWLDIKEIAEIRQGIHPGWRPYPYVIAEALARRLDAARAIAGDAISY
jgi:hypothetical protein